MDVCALVIDDLLDFFFSNFSVHIWNPYPFSGQVYGGLIEITPSLR